MQDFSSSSISLQPYTPYDPASIAGFGGMRMPENPGGFTPTGSSIGSVGPLGGVGLGGWLGQRGLGTNIPTFNAAIGGLQTLGNLWGGMKQLKLAKKQMGLSRDFANANLENQTKSYNTAISDRARSRGAAEGQSQSQVDDYITRNSLAQRTVR